MECKKCKHVKGAAMFYAGRHVCIDCIRIYNATYYRKRRTARRIYKKPAPVVLSAYGVRTEFKRFAQARVHG